MVVRGSISCFLLHLPIFCASPLFVYHRHHEQHIASLPSREGATPVMAACLHQAPRHDMVCSVGLAHNQRGRRSHQHVCTLRASPSAGTKIDLLQRHCGRTLFRLCSIIVTLPRRGLRPPHRHRRSRGSQADNRPASRMAQDAYPCRQRQL